MVLIKQKELFDFSREWHEGKYPHQRFGQAFCNKFNVDDSKLFYCSDPNEVAEMLVDYTDWSYLEDFSKE